MEKKVSTEEKSVLLRVVLTLAVAVFAFMVVIALIEISGYK